MTVRVRYHQDAGAWWADSPDLTGWTAAADSLAELRDLVREAVVLLATGEGRLVEEGLPGAR